MKLLSYDVEIIHRPGSQMKVADALSRAFEDNITSIEQVHDPWYRNKFFMLKNNPDKFPDFCIRDGKLFFHKPCSWINPLLVDNDAWKQVLPQERHLEFLQKFHEDPQSAHLGREKTYEVLSRYFYWPGMFVDVSRFV